MEEVVYSVEVQALDERHGGEIYEYLFHELFTFAELVVFCTMDDKAEAEDYLGAFIGFDVCLLRMSEYVFNDDGIRVSHFFSLDIPLFVVRD